MSRLAPPATFAEHRVLLVNDDGIHAPGLMLLEELVRQFTDDVWVVAPDEEKSGASHSLSLTMPLRIREIDNRHFAVKGTPTDCALLAIHEIMAAAPPTVLLSGINRGANLAEDVTYSGTAAAAMEGALLGFRAIALSQVFSLGREPFWDTSRAFLRPVLEKLLVCDWVPGAFVNVNFPDVPPECVQGIRVTLQGARLPGSFRPEKRVDGRQVPYYWITFAHKLGNVDPASDLQAMRDKMVSVTPMQLDLTAHPFRHYLDAQFREGA
jgi:5'/3'-nucleotidase